MAGIHFASSVKFSGAGPLQRPAFCRIDPGRQHPGQRHPPRHLKLISYPQHRQPPQPSRLAASRPPVLCFTIFPPSAEHFAGFSFAPRTAAPNGDHPGKGGQMVLRRHFNGVAAAVFHWAQRRSGRNQRQAWGAWLPRPPSRLPPPDSPARRGRSRCNFPG